MQIELGGLTFNRDDGGVSPTTGDRYIVDVFDWGSPDVDLVELAPSGRDGVVFGEGFERGRSITIEGVAIPGPGRRHRDVRSTIADAFSKVAASGTLIVREGNPDKRVLVRRPGRLRFDLNSGEFSVVVRSADPRIYDASLTTVVTNVGAAFLSGDAVCVNNGNNDLGTFPTITVEGPSNDLIQLLHVGKAESVFWDDSLTAGVNLIFDFAAKTVRRGGVSRYDAVRALPKWFTLDPGSNTVRVVRTGTTGPLTLTVTYRGAYA